MSELEDFTYKNGVFGRENPMLDGHVGALVASPISSGSDLALCKRNHGFRLHMFRGNH